MENTQQSKRQSVNGINLVDIWSVQCGECFKWRLIPTEEEFEEIRSKITDDPFVCSKKPDVSCDDPADIERDDSRTWAIHKPGIPETPAGFKRRLVMRKDFSKMDCYYDAPNGKKFRALTDVSKFLDKFPKYKRDISTADFSFTSPKIMDDTIPTVAGKKL
ncbi:methyl-CPG-binding domain 4 [Perilla frutescens var. hirtella]|uniref:Methyl-CPG-binding domain 4 n=1 Tax=Perilla frutescens var. hirtella TaxID=608512 RepID=A0AAD4P0M9_PERFH|nr:methyl-CPG-binding domain 4 [Perilla frutescens var. hirtella]KAH6811098.1 methyl-CPG-binding domain 4 [Perilla frutescens var. frutescens]KAH6821785.1 methyl-CPG-binding domain 4 [Perilla frutescens var. hirtella]